MTAVCLSVVYLNRLPVHSPRSMHIFKMLMHTDKTNSSTSLGLHLVKLQKSRKIFKFTLLQPIYGSMDAKVFKPHNP